MRIGEGDVEVGSGGCLHETFPEYRISVNTKAGAVSRTRKLQERCNGLLCRAFRKSQPLAVVPDGASGNSLKHDFGRTAAVG